MSRAWLQNGRLITAADSAKVCVGEDCPCGPAPTGCQCLLHYRAVYCLEDRFGVARWLTVNEVKNCSALWTDITGVTANIFYKNNDSGDGCFDLGGEELPTGWDPWCNSGGPNCTAGPDDLCPGGTVWCLATYVGAFNCTPCDNGATLSNCARPSSFPSLPADPTMIDPCGV